MANANLSKGYKEQAFELACLIGKFEDISDRLKYLDDLDAGNFFPSSAAESAFKPLACALAHTVVYWHELEEEEKSGNDKGSLLAPVDLQQR